MSITLYYSPGSCSLAPHIVLNEIGKPFELRKFATANRENYSTEYLDVNPKGRIPALVMDGFTITENPAILAFLGRQFPEANLYPVATPQSEARCLELLAWSSNTAHVAFAQLFRPERFVLDEVDHGPVKESGQLNFKQCLAEIEAELTHQNYAVGDRFSVVDPFWLVFYRWGRLAGYEMRVEYPFYTTFAERLCARESVQRALDTEDISVFD
ncbi:MAG: glutathione S-transferase C-terminal domain-containing protein [Acidiferrobacterales bacterium]|nr:glutathione S-transferase C-terminal domain-containing protein [Acidiferrobacterales bacterium]